LTERLDRIEANLLAITEIQRASAAENAAWRKESAAASDAWQAKHNHAMARVIEAQEVGQRSMATLTESISKYVDSSDARMKRLEENLDGLIRAITAEHSNGKSRN